MQIADKYYLNYLAKFIADNRYYRNNFEKIIDYRDKKYCTDNGNPRLKPRDTAAYDATPGAFSIYPS